MIRQSICKRLDKVSRLPTQKAMVAYLNFNHVDGLSDDGIGCCCTMKGLRALYGEHSTRYTYAQYSHQTLGGPQYISARGYRVTLGSALSRPKRRNNER